MSVNQEVLPNRKTTPYYLDSLLYARASIPEVWLINLSEDCVEVHRRPTQDDYQKMRRMERGDVVAPMAFPDLELLVDAILDPAEHFLAPSS